MTPDQIKAAIAAVVVLGALAIGFGGGWLVQGWRLKTEIAEADKARAVEDATAANGALATLKTDALAIHAAAGELGAIKLDLGPKFAALSREIKNAPKPLVPGCRPDDYRVQNLAAAIAAANAAIARAGTSGALPAGK